VSGTTLAAALGLVVVPPIGASIAEAFDMLGPQAVFGPGCGDPDATQTIQAPPRWAYSVPAQWRVPGVRIMAQIDGRTVQALHLALPPVRATNEAQCSAALARLSQKAPQSAAWRGPVRIIVSEATAVAAHRAQYRAIYRPSRGECRTMLTIGNRQPS